MNQVSANTTSSTMANVEDRSEQAASRALFCGWGRVLFAQTFEDPAELAREMQAEKPGERDIAAYVRDPHVVLSHAPQRLFLDPSDMLRLALGDLAMPEPPRGVEIRRVADPAEAQAINDLYVKRDMVPSDPAFIWNSRAAEDIHFLVAVDSRTGQVVGTVTGLDHVAAFDDSSSGSSLWCLAVDPAAVQPGIGEGLVRALAFHYQALGRSYMDLSVVHDNVQAKALYAKLGFEPVQVFAIKTKNAHNEALFIGPELDEGLNPYARIIVDEARARGISVQVLDEAEGYFRLSRGGKSVVCRESLSELTSAIAMSRCQDKYVTHRWLNQAGLATPALQLAGPNDLNGEFLGRHRTIVVKPAIGEQGNGITVGIDSLEQLEPAIERAAKYSERVLLESFHPGEDLRIVVINGQVVAASVRRPAQIVGDGARTAQTLIEKQSRRRGAATGGESSIPIDEETRRCLREAGYTLGSVIPADLTVTVRGTANLHTGGTMHDVTDELHPVLTDVAERAAERLSIPVVGLDLIVQDPKQPDYVIIEANERPGLANHEPQPTAQRFLDLLFPLSFSALEPIRE